ncbi:MAG: membrane protein insertion efficiency factor YidD [Verrucomicrobia bacterium]|nr:membrane protein insertion efficiency factor YidD [Verrucomicrobiota bacterium]
MRFKFLLLFLPLSLQALPGYHAPWGKDADLKTIPIEQPQAPPSIPVRVAQKIIRFHQKVLSPVDGPRSHFIPSSSQYMYLAMQKHGFIEGFIMGCDRLMRENGDDWVYRKIEIDGKLYKTDPIR